MNCSIYKSRDFSLLMFGIKSYTIGFDTILNIKNTFTPCIHSGISKQLNINYEKLDRFAFYSQI
jgi:hypothetical protein